MDGWIALAPEIVGLSLLVVLGWLALSSLRAGRQAAARGVESMSGTAAAFSLEDGEMEDLAEVDPPGLSPLVHRGSVPVSIFCPPLGVSSVVRLQAVYRPRHRVELAVVECEHGPTGPGRCRMACLGVAGPVRRGV